MDILTVKEAALERLEHCTKEVSSRVVQAVRTVYRQRDHDERPEAIGTCFLLQDGPRKYLVTAAHIFDFAEENSIYVAGEISLVRLNGAFWVTPKIDGSRREDKHDVAFQLLSEDMVGKLGAVLYLNADEISLNRGSMDGRMYIAMGYPSSRNKPNQVDLPRKHVKARAWTYASTAFTEPSKYYATGASESVHILIKHSHKYSRTFGGHRTQSVRPQGASGGVLIDLGLPDPNSLRPGVPCIGKLAGMLIEKHNDHDAIVAVKIEVILGAMRGALVKTDCSVD